MTFSAPWSKRLGYSTLIFILILFGASMLGRDAVHYRGFLAAFMITGVPLLVAGGSSFFMIRGYVITENALFVQRFLWHTRIDLSGLRAFEPDPIAMSGSLRTFGNGGLFCTAGYFHNEKLGSYRAFATDPRLAVVLHFTDKVIVVTPDNPEQFVAALKEIVAA